jgi:hypothetical protein
MELSFAEVLEVNRRLRPRLCLCVDERGYPLGSCSVCDGGGGVTGCATCSGGGMLPSGRGATGVCPQCKWKGYQPHRFSREMLVKAAQLRKQRNRKG